jgi:hypothetical protein
MLCFVPELFKFAHEAHNRMFLAKFGCNVDTIDTEISPFHHNNHRWWILLDIICERLALVVSMRIVAMVSSESRDYVISQDKTSFIFRPRNIRLCTFCVECTVEKNDVRIQITHCAVRLYKSALRKYRPCVHMMT